MMLYRDDVLNNPGPKARFRLLGNMPTVELIDPDLIKDAMAKVGNEIDRNTIFKTGFVWKDDQFLNMRTSEAQTERRNNIVANIGINMASRFFPLYLEVIANNSKNWHGKEVDFTDQSL